MKLSHFADNTKVTNKILNNNEHKNDIITMSKEWTSTNH